MKLLTKIFFSVVVCSSVAAAQSETVIANPVEVSEGVVFTNSGADGLYREYDGAVDELVSAPGCGNYFSVSPDGKTIGFKYIFDDGLQSPALLDIATKKITFLQSPVKRAGQVRFSKNGAVVYSVEETVFVQQNDRTVTIPIGTYANIVDISFDGTLIAYNDNSDHLYVQNIATREVHQISGSGFFFPLWSPVENTLCYSTLGSGLFAFNAGTQQTVSLGSGMNPVWSADGSSVIVERRETDHDVLLNSDLYKISVDGKHVVRLTETNNIFETEPAVGAGQSIIYTSHNGGNIFLLAQDGKSKTLAAIQKEMLASETKTPGVSSLKKISSPAAYFEMPYVNQVYDTPDWYNGHSACGATASIMILAYYGLLPEWKVWLTATYPAHWSYYGNYIAEKYHFRGINYTISASDPNGKPSWGGYGFMWGAGSPFSRTVAYYQAHGLTSTRQGINSDGLGAPSNDFVVNEVTSGYPYTLCNGLTTAGHIIAINGIGSENHTLIANDPYGNKNSGSYPSHNGKGVSYDWPGYNNGHKNLNNIWWGISVRPPTVTLADSIVDDLQFTSGFSMSNTGTSSMYSWNDKTTGGYNGHFWYVKTRVSDTCYASWSPTITADGMYAVSAYIPFSNAKAARYIVHYSGGIDTVVVDQTQYGNTWAELGTFPFTTSGGEYVRLGDGSDSTGQEIVFDAIQFKYTSALSVARSSAIIPNEMSLSQNFPNPFNPSTEIRFSVPAEEYVSLKVYSVLGKEISTLADGPMNPGIYNAHFNASALASGVYLYRLQVGSHTLSKKMMLVK